MSKVIDNEVVALSRQYAAYIELNDWREAREILKLIQELKDE